MGNEKFQDVLTLTADEIDLIRKFRALDERGKLNVIGAVNFEYHCTIAGVGEKLTTGNFDWLKNAVITGGQLQSRK